MQKGRRCHGEPYPKRSLQEGARERLLGRTSDEEYREDDSNAERIHKDASYIKRLGKIIRDCRSQTKFVNETDVKQSVSEIERRAGEIIFSVVRNIIRKVGVKDEDLSMMTLEEIFKNLLDGRFKGGNLDNYVKTTALRLMKTKIKFDLDLSETENNARTILMRCERQGELLEHPFSCDEVYRALRKGRIGQKAAVFFSSKDPVYFRREYLYGLDGSCNEEVLNSTSLFLSAPSDCDLGISCYFTTESIFDHPDSNPILSAFIGDFEEWLIVAVMMLYWEYSANAISATKRSFIKEKGAEILSLYDYAAFHKGEDFFGTEGGGEKQGTARKIFNICLERAGMDTELFKAIANIIRYCQR